MKHSGIVALIPARGGSKGVPRKNIRLLEGKPLISYAIRAAKNARRVEEVYVSTDDTAIGRVAKAYGAHIVKRPKALAVDTAPSEWALLHFAKQTDFDILVFLQCTSPLTIAADIDAALDFFEEQKLDSLLTVNEEYPFLWDKHSRPVNYDYRRRMRRQDREPTYRETGAFYITKRKTLLEGKNRLGGRIGLYVMPHMRSVEIDSPEDFLLAATAIRFFKKNGGLTNSAYRSHPLIAKKKT